MIHPARRLRQFVMAAAPGMVIGGWRLGTAGAAAVLLQWLALGALLPGISRLPYAHRRRIRPHRLFLGYAAGLALLCIVTAAGKRWAGIAAGSPVLLTTGAVCFALILCQQTLRLSLPRTLSWGVGGALCATALAVGW